MTLCACKEGHGSRLGDEVATCRLTNRGTSRIPSSRQTVPVFISNDYGTWAQLIGVLLRQFEPDALSYSRHHALVALLRVDPDVVLGEKDLRASGKGAGPYMTAGRGAGISK